MSYNTKLGRTMLNLRRQLTKTIPEKWHGILPASYQPRWIDVWNKHRPQKDAGFLWSVFHCVVAVNAWRIVMALVIPIACLCCQAGLEETILHMFFHCARTRLAWQFALTVLYSYLTIPQPTKGWPQLTWQQCLLGSKLPRQLLRRRQLWSLFRGSVIWVSWVDRNALCFRNEVWPQYQVNRLLWKHFLDHGRMAWQHTCCTQKNHPLHAARLLRQFDRQWMYNRFFGTRDGLRMHWKVAWPQTGNLD
jgi:hypothetical protein